MSFDEEYYDSLKKYYNNFFNSINKKYTKCDGCSNNKKFIIQKNDNITTLIYTCGDVSGDCGPQLEIVLPLYSSYINDYNDLYNKINNNIDYDVLKKYINIDISEYEKKEKLNLKAFEELKIIFNKSNSIQDKYEQSITITRKINDLKKDNFKKLDEIKKELNLSKKKELQIIYIKNNNEINDLTKKMYDIKNSINDTLIISKPSIKIKDIVINEKSIDPPTLEKLIKQADKQLSDEGWPKYEPESPPPIENSNDDEIKSDDEKLIDDITDIERYNKIKNPKFTKEKKKECEESILWNKLSKAKNEKEYKKILVEINTNPKYYLFNQIYFHAGDSIQFQRYGYIKTRMLSYPIKNIELEDKMYNIYNGYNIDTTYQTFKYLFDKLKKGIYISFRNGKLDVFLPFSNIKYHNNWHDIIEDKNPELFKKMIKNDKNLSDPSRWYANNCFLNTKKYKYINFLEEGDKTVIPLKYFLIYFEKYCNKNNLTIPDVDYFFSPRDFPVLRHNNLEPYDKIFPNKKLEPQYIHKNYTPILCQSGNTNYHDIPVPTEDDMLRISPDIYPDSCKNKYNDMVEFDTDWNDKKSECVFRGNATGCGITIDTNMRLKAANLSFEWKKNGYLKNSDGKDVLDVKLIGWNNRRPKIDGDTFDYLDPKDFKFKVGEFNSLDLEQQSKYKYILNIDGHVKAFRLGNEMRMGSVVLLVDSPYTLWFQDKLKSIDIAKNKDIDYIDENYILIKNDLSDLDKKLQWCLDNDDKCKKIAENSKIFYNKYLSREGTYEYYYNLINDLSRIRRIPLPNMNNYMSLIVAYRDPGDGSRKAQLDIFLQQMQVLLNGKINYHIYVIEQESDRPDYDSLSDEFKQANSRMAKFNLGIIKNIGFQIANRDNKEDNNYYYILSDVDLLPSMELLHKYLEYPKNPIHLANKGTRYNSDGKNKTFLGGVLSINRDDFTKSNGYPNNFWGWGGEDDVLSSRLQLKNIDIDKPKESVIDLEEMTWNEKKEILNKNKYKEMQKWEKSCKDNDILYDRYKNKCQEYNIINENTWNKNGVKNLKSLYKIIDRNDNDKVSHIKVYLNIDPKEPIEKEPIKKEPIKIDTIEKEPIKIEPIKIDTPEHVKLENKRLMDIQKVKNYNKPITLVGLYNLTKKNSELNDVAIVGIETKNFPIAMNYLRNNTWIVEYMHYNVLKDLKDNNYYDFGSTELDEKITLELSKRRKNMDTYDLSPQLQPDSDEVVKEIVIGSNVKWTKNGQEYTGLIEKITKNSYKICCKPGKISGEKSSVYMVPQNIVKLNDI